MSGTPLPQDAGVYLQALKPGLIAGVKSHMLGQAEIDRAAPYAKRYNEMDGDFQARVDALVRADGRVPIKALQLLWDEFNRKRQLELNVRAVRGALPMPGRFASLRDTTESDLT